MLRGENISIGFDKKQVLDDISISANEGQIVGLIGRNGSGKTTILKILSQVIDPDTGSLYLDDKDLKTNPQLKGKIAYLPDNFNYFPYTNINRIIDYYKAVYDGFDEEFARKEISDLGLSTKVNSRNFSKGQRSLLGTIITLATPAKYLLLDEVLDGMDVLNTKKILRYLILAQDHGRSVVISSHQLGEIESVADKVYYLSLDGKLAEKSEGAKDLLKYQIVVSDKLSDSLKKDLVVEKSIARVYTVLVKGEESYWQDRFQKEGIVQYDKLPVKLEDMFFYEKGARI